MPQISPTMHVDGEIVPLPSTDGLLRFAVKGTLWLVNPDYLAELGITMAEYVRRSKDEAIARKDVPRPDSIVRK